MVRPLVWLDFKPPKKKQLEPTKPKTTGQGTWSHAQALWQAQHGITAVHGGGELLLDGTVRSPVDSPVRNLLDYFMEHHRNPIGGIDTIGYCRALWDTIGYFIDFIGPSVWPHGGFHPPLPVHMDPAPAMPPPRPRIHPIHRGNGHAPGRNWWDLTTERIPYEWGV